MNAVKERFNRQANELEEKLSTKIILIIIIIIIIIFYYRNYQRKRIL